MSQWYCWPEGYLGQSFNLAGKLEPRASPLQEDVDTLGQYAKRHREMCRYSEHTLDSAAQASQMVQAVVGGAVDMGMLNASGSASFQMSRVSQGPGVQAPLCPELRAGADAVALTEHARDSKPCEAGLKE